LADGGQNGVDPNPIIVLQIFTAQGMQVESLARKRLNNVCAHARFMLVARRCSELVGILDFGRSRRLAVNAACDRTQGKIDEHNGRRTGCAKAEESSAGE